MPIPVKRLQVYQIGPGQVRAGGINPGGGAPGISFAGGGNSSVAAIADAGQKLVDIAAREYVKTETTRVSQSLTELQAMLSAERDRYMSENQGQYAIEAGVHFEKFAREAAQKFLQDGKFQGRFAEMYEKQVAGSILHFTEQGNSYARQQRQVWENSVLDGEINEFQNLVAQNYNNPEFIEFNRENLRERISNMRPGVDNRALFAKLDQTAASSVIDGYLAHDDIRGAKGAFNQYRGILGDKVNAVEVQIQNRALMLENKALAAAERARVQQERELLRQEKEAARAATQEGINLFVKYGDNVSYVRTAISEIKDPVLQGKVIQGYLSQQGLHERLARQEQEQQKAALYSENIDQVDLILQDTEVGMESRNSSLTEVLNNINDPKIRKAVSDHIDFRLNGVEAPVDVRVMADALAYAEQEGVTADMVRARYAGSLPPSGLAKATRIATDAEGKLEASMLKDEIIQRMGDFDFTGSQATDAYHAILYQIQGVRGYENRRKEALALCARLSVKKPDAWFGEKEVPAIYFSREAEEGYSKITDVDDIPKIVQLQLDEDLKIRGLELTDKNRIRIYRDKIEQDMKK